VGGTVPTPVTGVSVVPPITSIGWAGVARGQPQGQGLSYVIQTEGIFPSRDGSSPTATFIGQVFLFAGNFAPAGTAFCDGSLLQIQANTALFSVIGTMYGGNGTTNFALPDLRARTTVGLGTLPSPASPPATSDQIPLVTSVTLGEIVQGQIGVLGMGSFVARGTVFPSPNSGGEQPYVSQMMLFAGNFTPSGLFPANGGILPINQHQTLFALLGTMFGGNGATTFALPNLSSRVSMGTGTR
jgi:microcystin-dependent protein